MQNEIKPQIIGQDSLTIDQNIDVVKKNDLAKKLTKERFANGAISLDQEEVKFILDKNMENFVHFLLKE